jgi:hypothetical protein
MKLFQKYFATLASLSREVQRSQPVNYYLSTEIY